VASDHGHRVLSLERNAARQHLEDDRAEAVDVGSPVHRSAGELLRGRVRDRSDELVRPGQPRLVGGLADVREAEVHDLVDALPWRELVRDDVGGLQVAMDDAVAMGEMERGAQRRHDRLHVVERQSAALADFLLDAAAVQQLHHQERTIGLVGVEVEDRDDVGVAQAGTRPALAHEPLDRTRTGVVGADDLDGDLVAKQQAPRPVDGAHAAFGERGEDLVPAVKDLPDRQHGDI
jgi:hypothetical protein